MRSLVKDVAGGPELGPVGEGGAPQEVLAWGSPCGAPFSGAPSEMNRQKDETAPVPPGKVAPSLMGLMGYG